MANSNPRCACAPRVNQEVLAAIDELVDESEGEGDEGSDNSRDWMKLVNHGGLFFVNDITYMTFHANEIV